MQKSRRVSLGILISLLAVLGLVWWQRLAIYDWARLRSYDPPAAVVALADNTTMTDGTRRLFYVNRPAIEDKTQFNQDCADSEQTIVLGCYVSGDGIFLYKVDDPRLQGVMEVTAAHEALHAAYERLDANEQGRINQLTAAAFSKVTDERLRKTIDAYRAKDPAVVPNELHSILATEVRSLPAELEEYYSQYFKDRSKVVGYSERYQQVFTSRQEQIATYDGRMKNLKQQIDSLQRSLETQQQNLMTQKAQMDALLAAEQYQQYNAQVNSYNSRVRQYNAQVGTAQSLIDQYNQLVEERNALALEASQLVKSIDSRPTTVQTQ